MILSDYDECLCCYDLMIVVVCFVFKILGIILCLYLVVMISILLLSTNVLLFLEEGGAIRSGVRNAEQVGGEEGAAHGGAAFLRHFGNARVRKGGCDPERGAQSGTGRRGRGSGAAFFGKLGNARVRLRGEGTGYAIRNGWVWVDGAALLI